MGAPGDGHTGSAGREREGQKHGLHNQRRRARRADVETVFPWRGAAFRGKDQARGAYRRALQLGVAQRAAARTEARCCGCRPGLERPRARA